ncbi:MAG: MraY family glycosyltransferase [Planctomycetota bacterium]
MVWLCLSLVALGAFIALPACDVARRVSNRLGAHDTAPIAGQEKPAHRAIPNTGGIGIAVAIGLPIAIGLLVANLVHAGTVGLPGWLGPASVHVEGAADRTPMGIAFLGGLVVLHVLGLVDDRRPLGWLIKLVLMLGPAAVLAVFFQTRLLELLDPYVGGAWLSVVATVLWFGVVINAMNFIDNMDGLSAGVAAIAGACFLAAALINGQWFVAGVLGLLVGACCGFLVLNFPCAKLFMGDGGSLVIGYTLAFLTVRTTYVGDEGLASGAWYGVFMPLVVLAVPLYDFVTVTLIRLKEGRSPFVGSMQHLSHRLVRRGLTRRDAVLVIWGCTLLAGLSGVALATLRPWQAALAVAQVGVLLVVLALLEYSSRPRGEGRA